MPNDKVEVGMMSDELLEIKPREEMTKDPKVIGFDGDGLVTEWYYSDMTVEIRRAKREGELPLEAYCICKITEVEEE